MSPPRLLLVSNRLPVTVRRSDDGSLQVTRSAGGLASAIEGARSSLRARWVGWPGAAPELGPRAARRLDAELRALGAVPVEIPREEAERHYDGFSNQVLWPTLHSLIDGLPLDCAALWAAYRSVNHRFCRVVAEHHAVGEAVWVHDYHLFLLPRLLRSAIPDAPIGFFLHVPFPGEDVFRVLPWARQLLEGVLGADVIGFHTAAYRDQFARAVRLLLGLSVEGDVVRVGTRAVKLGVFPIAPDVDAIEQQALSDETRAEVESLRGSLGGSRRLLVGIDRLDYTKGITRRLLAFERLLERKPALRQRVRFLQLGVPTRETVATYGEIGRLIHENVARINATKGDLGEAPIHFLRGNLPLERLVALYGAADVLVVTPIRDGMNLVAKEYVAARIDGDGALVLSELAGAAAELRDALHVNPYDIDGVAAAMDRALTMSSAERRRRMQGLRRAVRKTNVHTWAESFVAALVDAHAPDDFAERQIA